MNKITALIICSLQFALCAAQSTKGEIREVDTEIQMVEEPATAEDSAKVFIYVEHMPEFKGGEEGRLAFIGANTKYPNKAKEKGVQGTVILSFIVQPDGSTVEHKVMSSVHPLLDEEALRVARLMNFEKPGKQNGKAVRVQFYMPIKFVLK